MSYGIEVVSHPPKANKVNNKYVLDLDLFSVWRCTLWVWQISMMYPELKKIRIVRYENMLV